jgi:hypothetical protein
VERPRGTAAKGTDAVGGGVRARSTTHGRVGVQKPVPTAAPKDGAKSIVTKGIPVETTLKPTPEDVTKK